MRVLAPAEPAEIATRSWLDRGDRHRGRAETLAHPLCEARRVLVVIDHLALIERDVLA
jgi:hypothetical protein